MKDASLGLNHWLSFSATCQTVRPPSSARSSGHLRMAPPNGSSDMPRCCRYHATSAALSPLLLKKTPPTPVTLAIVVSPGGPSPDVVRRLCHGLTRRCDGNALFYAARDRA